MSKVYFNSSLHIAGLQDESGISICTILNNPGEKRASITAYLGARYSRSADAMIDIAEEIRAAGTDAAARLEKIFHGYGHKSVGDMAQLFVCIENVPIYISMRSFYMNPVYAGQERSTRYQDFSKPNYVKLPEDAPAEAKQLYENVMNHWIKSYTALKDKTYEALKKVYQIDPNNPKQASALRARAFDTVRYFVPLGMRTSFGLQMSARSFGEFISFLRGSLISIEQKIGDLLLTLLSGTNKELQNLGYIPEADGLVRHTEPNDARNKSTKEILLFLQKYIKEKGLKIEGYGDLKQNITKLFNVSTCHDINTDILTHYLLLLHPTKKFTVPSEVEKELLEQIGKILAKYHNHHVQIGNKAQTGAILIEGFADLGSLKDINRHRSLERFIPVWEPTSDIVQEFNRNLEKMFSLADYLEHPELKDLKDEYAQAYIQGYEKLMEWLNKAPNLLDENTFNEYTRYLLTHGHKTRYRIYGSLDDLQYTINLRTRNGGHIAYRNLTYHWGKEIAKQFPLFKGFMENIVEVNPFSKKQFVDRS